MSGVLTLPLGGVRLLMDTQQSMTGDLLLHAGAVLLVSHQLSINNLISGCKRGLAGLCAGRSAGAGSAGGPAQPGAPGQPRHLLPGQGAPFPA